MNLPPMYDVRSGGRGVSPADQVNKKSRRARRYCPARIPPNAFSVTSSPSFESVSLRIRRAYVRSAGFMHSQTARIRFDGQLRCDPMDSSRRGFGFSIGAIKLLRICRLPAAGSVSLSLCTRCASATHSASVAVVLRVLRRCGRATGSASVLAGQAADSVSLSAPSISDCGFTELRNAGGRSKNPCNLALRARRPFGAHSPKMKRFACSILGPGESDR